MEKILEELIKEVEKRVIDTVMEDIEFGYDLGMIKSKIQHGSYVDNSLETFDAYQSLSREALTKQKVEIEKLFDKNSCFNAGEHTGWFMTKEKFIEVVSEALTGEQERKEECEFIVKEDMICPVTKSHCDDECCPVGSICNLSGGDPLSNPVEPKQEP